MTWTLPSKTEEPPGAAPKSSWAVKIARCWAALTGTIWMFPGTVPTGWLACDGTSYLRADYPDLFAALGGAASPWGRPDGTHFNVPDLRGRQIIGVGTGSGLTARARAASLGVETHPLITAELGSHFHMMQRWSTGPAAGVPGDLAATDFNATPADTMNTDPQGGGSAHQNMNPFAVLNVAIKA